MSLESRIDTLQKEHDRLDGMIAREISHPSSNDLELAHLKREKLRLKDDIVRLSGKQYAHTG